MPSTKKAWHICPKCNIKRDLMHIYINNFSLLFTQNFTEFIHCFYKGTVRNVLNLYSSINCNHGENIKKTTEFLFYESNALTLYQLSTKTSGIFLNVV